MEFKIMPIDEVVTCRIVNRVNRFVVKLLLQGNYYLAHTNNTGRLHQFLVEGKTAFCVKNNRGKTDYRLFAIQQDDILAALIDTQLQMLAFEKSLGQGLIPWLTGYKLVKRNARLGASLIDYLLEGDGSQVYLEVKSAVFREDNYAMYPDCPTARGRKHIKELTSYVLGGGAAIILFIAALPGVNAFKPYKAADPELYELLLEASRAGVEIKSISMAYNPEDSFIYLLNPDLNIHFV